MIKKVTESFYIFVTHISKQCMITYSRNCFLRWLNLSGSTKIENSLNYQLKNWTTSATSWLEFVMILQRRRSNSFLFFFLVLTTLCSTLFTIYIIYFSTLPKIPRHNSSPRLPNISNKGCASSSNSDASIPDANNVPLMNLRKQLGKNKKKVMLLIIVSTAPGRFERRQAIRTTWWKHCIDDKVCAECVYVNMRINFEPLFSFSFCLLWTI